MICPAEDDADGFSFSRARPLPLSLPHVAVALDWSDFKTFQWTRIHVEQGAFLKVFYRLDDFHAPWYMIKFTDLELCL